MYARWLNKRNRTIVGFLLPALALYFLILINPVVQSAFYSFTEYSGVAGSPINFAGAANFIEMFRDDAFLRSIANIGILIIVSLFVQLPVSLGMALILSKKLKGINIFKTIFFIPSVIPIVAVSLMWMFIFNPQWGILNSAIHAIGFKSFSLDWLGNPKVAMYSVALANEWVHVGVSMIIFAAGLTAIPQDLYEAASIDGAVGLRKLVYITIPLLKETFRIYFILVVTGAFKAFDLIFVMTGGGPNGATGVPTMMVYWNAFKYYNYGYACAVAVFILAAGFVLSFIINKLIPADGR